MAVQSLPALWTVPATIYLVEPDGTTGTLLDDRLDVAVQIKRHTESSVQFFLPASSPQAAMVPRLARIRVVFSMGMDGHAGSAVLFDATVRRRKRTHITADEEAAEGWSITAYDVGNDYAKRRAKVYAAGLIYEPPGGVGALARRGWEPFSQKRTMGWPDPSYVFNDHGATAAVQLWQQSNVLPFPYGRSGAPFGWLDNEAWWIWDRAISGLAHPAGTIYGDKAFTLVAGETKLIIDSAGDDAYELWIDGVLLCARKKEEDGSTWTRLARTEVTVGPGTHHLRFSCTNEGGGTGNIGGFICSVYDQADGTLICHTDNTWRVIGYPAEIGQTPGEIMIVLGQTEPLYRGFGTPWPIPGYSFTATTDSAGRPWPIIPKWPVDCGRPLQEALDQLASTFVEYEWASGDPSYATGHALHMWSAEGVTVAGGGTAPDPTTNYADGRLQAGIEGNAVDIISDEDSTQLFNVLLYMWGKGYSELTPAASGIAEAIDSYDDYGRHEGFLPIGDADDPNVAWATAFQNYLTGYDPKPTVTAKLSDGAGRYRDDVPFIHYTQRQNIESPTIDGPNIDYDGDYSGDYDWLRLVGMTITEDRESGKVDIVPNYATRTELWVERIQRWLQRQTLNPQNGLTDAASPDSPSIVSTTILNVEHETFSGDVATTGAVATPWQPSGTVAITQALARAEDAGAGITQIAVTIDTFPTSPLRQVDIAAGQKAGFAQFNGLWLLVAVQTQGVNVVVVQDGGHEHISVDLFHAPYPFAA